MAFHPIVDANHAWRLSTTIWSLQSSAGFVRKKNDQKKTDHIFNEIVVSVSFVQFLFYHCKLEAAVKF